MINFFERNGAQKCGDRTNPYVILRALRLQAVMNIVLRRAEWMLDVIGAGATATSTTDWHNVWIRSREFRALDEELDRIHAEGRKKPPVETKVKSEFSTSWPYQVLSLVQRGFVAYYRNPTYILAKLMLNIAGGLFIGFTFWKSKDTLQGTQNKLFVSIIHQSCATLC